MNLNHPAFPKETAWFKITPRNNTVLIECEESTVRLNTVYMFGGGGGGYIITKITIIYNIIFFSFYLESPDTAHPRIFQLTPIAKVPPAKTLSRWIKKKSWF